VLGVGDELYWIDCVVVYGVVVLVFVVGVVDLGGFVRVV